LNLCSSSCVTSATIEYSISASGCLIACKMGATGTVSFYCWGCGCNVVLESSSTGSLTSFFWIPGFLNGDTTRSLSFWISTLYKTGKHSVVEASILEFSVLPYVSGASTFVESSAYTFSIRGVAGSYLYSSKYSWRKQTFLMELTFGELAVYLSLSKYGWRKQPLRKYPRVFCEAATFAFSSTTGTGFQLCMVRLVLSNKVLSFMISSAMQVILFPGSYSADSRLSI
jgi:hypothetical protein